MSARFACLLTLVIACTAHAQNRLGLTRSEAIDRTATSRLPTVIDTAEVADAEKPASNPQPLQRVIKPLLESATQLLGEQLPDDATDVQREAFEKARDERLEQIVDGIAGRAVSTSIRVGNVIRRPLPPGVPSDETKRDPEDRKVAALHQRTPYMVIAEIEGLEPDLTAEQRKQIVEANGSYVKSLRQAHDLYKKSRNDDYDGEWLAETRKKLEAQRDDTVEEIRRKAETAKPNHRLYLLTNVSEVTEWRQGQRRRISGTIYKLGVFTIHAIYTRSGSLLHRFAEPKIQVELALVHDGSPSTGKGDDDESSARAMLVIGDNYRRAGRPKLAIEQYRKVIDKYPDTDAAAKARKQIARLK